MTSSSITGALGTVAADPPVHARGLRRRLRILLAVLGPGLIVMAGDNDAGAFGTYTQAGQDYGTHLLWTLPLLIPVLYVNQEMVLRLGAVTGVGHARLILERFGRFWGAFSVLDLFALNALTLVTEFIGISMGLSYLGMPRVPGVLVAAVAVVAAASTGSFRRFERTCLVLVAGSLLLVPLLLLSHPPLGQVLRDLVVPSLPTGAPLSTVVLLVIAVVGTTVAPWQLFFQQSYVIDKRLTPRHIGYEKVDLWIGIAVVVAGAAAMMAICSAAFSGTPEVGGFTDAAGVASGLSGHVGHVAGVLFALALIDASIIGAAAVSLSTAYAVGDVLGLPHTLHRGLRQARTFHAVLAALLIGAAVVVVIPGSPLGLITEGVQTLAGVLLPSATVFLLLLCNDHGLLGPWVNRRGTNILTTTVIAVLILLSLVLVVAVVFPDIGDRQLLTLLGGGGTVALLAGVVVLGTTRGRRHTTADLDRHFTDVDRRDWRMPADALATRPALGAGARWGLILLRGYLALAAGLVVVRVVELAVASR